MEQEGKEQKKRKWNVPKGRYGYMSWGKRFSALRTLLYFGISSAIFIMGWLSTGSKMNLLTVVAVLGMLPASKSAVNMIMYFRYSGCSAGAYERISPCAGDLDILYDLVMTTYQNTYVIASLALKGHTICGYTEDAGCDAAMAQKHIEETLKMSGYQGYTVKIFHDLDKYTARLAQMNRLEEENTGKKQEVSETLLSVSL